MDLPADLTAVTQDDLDRLLVGLSAERDQLLAAQDRVKAEHDRRAAWDRRAYLLSLMTAAERDEHFEQMGLTPDHPDREALLHRAAEVQAIRGQAVIMIVEAGDTTGEAGTVG